MFGLFFVTILLFALVQARAIVTNECQHKVWIWSIPFIGSSHTENVPIKPGGRYQEPWRLGSSGTPGVAIKVSTQANGIDMLADEINFAYSITNEDRSKIWVDLSPVRGNYLFRRVSFHSCFPGYTAANVEPHECNATDEVELVLCGTARTVPATDNASLEQIQACYQPESNDSDVSGGQAEYHGSFEAFSTGFDTGGTKEPVQNSPSILHAHCGTQWYDCLPCNDEAVHEEQSFEEESPIHDETPASNEPPHSNKLPVVGHCQAKVVYPGRRNIHMSPIPRGERTIPMTRNKQQASLCDIVEKYHPNVKGCNEEAMRVYARGVYPRLCEPENERLLMGFPCEDVAKELRSMYSGVTNAKRATEEQDDSDCECADAGPEYFSGSDTETSEDKEGLPVRCSDDDRECLSNFCEPVIPNVNCAYIARKLRAAAKSFGVNYQDLINENMETCPPTPRTTPDGRPIVCIAKLCTRLDMGSECGSLRTLLKHTAKAKLNQDIEFSTDDAVCGN